MPRDPVAQARRVEFDAFPVGTLITNPDRPDDYATYELVEEGSWVATYPACSAGCCPESKQDEATSYVRAMYSVRGWNSTSPNILIARLEAYNA
jgi:hypothetical protein